MSLEEALAKTTAALEANTALLEKLVARAVEAGAVNSAANAAEKPATKSTKTKEAKASDSGAAEEGKTDEGPKYTHDDVKAAASAWLGEFKGVEGDPETEARKAKIKGALASLTKKEGAQIADVPASELHRVIGWIEKQKAADNGFGVGRLTEKPGAKAAAPAGDDDI